MIFIQFGKIYIVEKDHYSKKNDLFNLCACLYICSIKIDYKVISILNRAVMIIRFFYVYSGNERNNSRMSFPKEYLKTQRDIIGNLYKYFAFHA